MALKTILLSLLVTAAFTNQVSSAIPCQTLTATIACFQQNGKQPATNFVRVDLAPGLNGECKIAPQFNPRPILATMAVQTMAEMQMFQSQHIHIHQENNQFDLSKFQNNLDAACQAANPPKRIERTAAQVIAAPLDKNAYGRLSNRNMWRYDDMLKVYYMVKEK